MSHLGTIDQHDQTFVLLQRLANFSSFSQNNSPSWQCRSVLTAKNKRSTVYLIFTMINSRLQCWFCAQSDCETVRLMAWAHIGKLLLCDAKVRLLKKNWGNTTENFCPWDLFQGRFFQYRYTVYLLQAMHCILNELSVAIIMISPITYQYYVVTVLPFLSHIRISSLIHSVWTKRASPSVSCIICHSVLQYNKIATPGLALHIPRYNFPYQVFTITG